MSKFYNSDLNRVPNSGGSVRLTIGTTGSTSNEAFQTTSTPCKKVWIFASANTVRVKFGSTCTSTTGIPVPVFETAAQSVWHLPLVLEIDDINKLFFYGSGGSETIDVLYRE